MNKPIEFMNIVELAGYIDRCLYLAWDKKENGFESMYEEYLRLADQAVGKMVKLSPSIQRQLGRDVK